MRRSTLPAGREADELPAVGRSHPVAAIGVDRAAIGPARHAMVSTNTRRLEIAPSAGSRSQRPDRSHRREGIGVVERPAIRAEGQAIGDEETADHRRALAVRIEAVEAAGGRAWLERIAHAADPEAPLAVAATVIQAVVGQMRLRGRASGVSCLASRSKR